MIMAVVVAERVEVEMTKSGLTLEDETLETDNLPQGVVEPMPREFAMDETAEVEVAMKLVKVNWPPLVRAKPAASIEDVHGVWEPPPQPEPVPVTKPADEICRHWEEAVVIPEMTRAEVEAVLETVSMVLVALVAVRLVVKKLVLVALVTFKELKVVKPVTFKVDCNTTAPPIY